MPPEVGLRVRTRSDVTIVNFEQARMLEAAQVAQIGPELYGLVDAPGGQKLVLDFSAVQFLASAAVGMLINVHKKSTAIHGRLVICGLRDELRKVFVLMKLDKLFAFCATEDEALAALSDPA